MPRKREVMAAAARDQTEPRAAGLWDRAIEKLKADIVDKDRREIEADTGKPYGETLLDQLEAALAAGEDLRPVAERIVQARRDGEYTYRGRGAENRPRQLEIAINVELALPDCKNVTAARKKVADEVKLSPDTVRDYHRKFRRRAQRHVRLIRLRADEGGRS